MLSTLAPPVLQATESPVVTGRNFEVLQTQEIDFVDLVRSDLSRLGRAIPRSVDLRPIQSKVKLQGDRGSCTYFVISSMLESLIKKRMGREIDISEEYMAWASKTKMKMRILDEGSSVAVDAATVQTFGFMLEDNLPYQLSWFNEGMPCAGQEETVDTDPVCYSHNGPSLENEKNVISGKDFVFEAVESSVVDVINALAKNKAPVTASMLVHHDMLSKTAKTGDLYLSAKDKKDCILDKKKCGGHAVLIVGYDLDKKLFTFKNSWGETWGDSGYGTIHFDYMSQMSARKFLSGKLTADIQIP